MEMMFDYEKAIDSLRHLLRDEVGPQVLALRKNRKIAVSTKKTYADIVTEADKLSERIIRGYLQSKYPDHNIFGEEGTREKNSESQFEWFIDPIDGTIPYASGGENFGICISLIQKSVPVMGIIFYPARGKLLHAIRGRGAFLNGERVRNVKEKVDLENSVIALSAPAGPSGNDYLDTYVKPVNERVRLLVFSGSYSADTLQLMEGSLDAVVLANASPYDAVATMIIAKEAGYEVCGIHSDEIDFHREKVPVLYAATKGLQRELIALLRPKSQ